MTSRYLPFLPDITPRQSPTSLEMICEWMDDYTLVVVNNSNVELCLNHSQEVTLTADLARSVCALFGARLLQPDTPGKVALVNDIVITCELYSKY